MFPVIRLGTFSVPTFTLFAIAGVSAFILSALFKIRKLKNSAREAYFILPKLFIAMGVAFCGAIIFDALFKIPENGGFRISGITFYGGVLTGIPALAVMLALSKRNTGLTVFEWLNLLTVPFLIFHFLGRIGCFMGGCCYGKTTSSPFGIVFPDNEAAGIFHYGQKVFPTQLYEAAAIAVIAVTATFTAHKFALYCFSYPVARFAIEFLRGDDRGGYFGILSPAQLVSVIVFSAAVLTVAAGLVHSRIKRRRGVKN